jgi:putative PIN family toxin of toxin-antitoxin system
MFDTNILISAGIFNGSHLSELVFDIADNYQLVLSSQIINELWRVVDRKFPSRKLVMDRFLRHLSYVISYTPVEIDENIYPIIRDKSDYPILASALIADVDVLITGDHDFYVLDIRRPQILTIQQFAQQYPL